MNDWTPREQWPQWLKGADTDGALVRVVSGYVHWLGGTWRGGTWLGGVWHGGDWHGGRSSVRSRYRPIWDGSRIHIDCEAKSIPEWDEWFAGAEQYETPRNTEAFRLIHAHYQAIRAWVVAMGWHAEDAQ